MASNASSVASNNTSRLNTHGAMTPELMHDIRHRVRGMRPWVRLSDLDTDKQPNLILSGRKGSFVQQRQSFFRSTSKSSSQSSLNSPGGSNRSSLRSPTSPRKQHSSGDEGTNRPAPSSVNLPTIPSKTLKERGILDGIRKHGDVSKRSGEEQEEDVGSKKIRRLSSRESQRSSWSSFYSDKDETASGHSVEKVPSNTSDVVMRRKIQKTSALKRQGAVTSDDQENSRPSSTHSGKFISASGSTRSSSSHSEKKTSQSSSRPMSSHSERNGSSNVSTPRDGGQDFAGFRRQDSAASNRSPRSKGQESEEDDKRSSTGYGVLQMSSSSSRKGSEKGSRWDWNSKRHRPSFHTIQGSSTPVMPRHSLDSSSSSLSSPRSPPPPPAPLVIDTLPDSTDLNSALPLPSPPPMLSSPSPPPTPPATSPPASPPPLPVSENQELFLPTPSPPPSGDLLPTPPSTPKSDHDRFSQSEELPLPPPENLPSPLRSLPSDSLPSPPALSRTDSSSSSSVSTPRTEQKKESEFDFLNFLPDTLPHDDTDSHKPIKITTSYQSGAEIATGQTEDLTSVEHPKTKTEETQTSPEKMEIASTGAEAIISSTTTTTFFSRTLDQEGENEKDNTTVPAPVIHFPPPPDYSPSHSPTLQATRFSIATSPLSPASPTSPPPGSSVSELSADHRLTSTSTDVVLGYLDNALEPYGSVPVTPLPVRSPVTYSLSSLPDSDHEHHTPTPPLPPPDVNVQGASSEIVLDFNAPQFSSSANNEVQMTAESSTKTETITTAGATFTTPNIITSTTTTTTTKASYVPNVELLHIPKKKGGKISKRKTTPTQVTKYEGSVKTVRRQIKPGHVEGLREIFIRQDDDDDDVMVRHGRRRMSQAVRSGSSDDEDDAKSGYSTTSSDNEYDLENAVKINSPDYSSSSPFSSPRMHEYSLNWEKEKSSTASMNTSSGASTPKAKRSGDGFVFEKDLSVHDASATSSNEADRHLVAHTESNRGTAEAESTPFVTLASLPTYSVPDPPIAVYANHSTAPLSASLPMQQTESKADCIFQTEGSEAKKEEGDPAIATTHFFSTPLALKTRSSSSESESSETGKQEGLVDTLSFSSSTDSKKEFLPAVKGEGTSNQHTSVLTGFLQGDSNSIPSHHDSNSVGPETGPSVVDRQEMIDADYALGNSPSPSRKVRGSLGLTGEVAIHTEGTERGDSSVAAKGERDDRLTIFCPKDSNNDDGAMGRGDGGGPSTAVGSDSHVFSTTYSSTIFSPIVSEKDSIITRTVTGEVTQGAVPGKHRDSLSLSDHTPSYSLPDTRTSSVEPGTPVASSVSNSERKQGSGTRAGNPDFLSILDDIQLEVEGFSTDTAQRARQLEEFKKDNRNSVEAPIPETEHTFKIDTHTVLTTSGADTQNIVQDVASTSLIVNGEKTGVEHVSTSEVSSDPELFFHDEDYSKKVLSSEKTITTRTVVESNGVSKSSTSSHSSSPSPPSSPTSAETVHETKAATTSLAYSPDDNKAIDTPPRSSSPEKEDRDRLQDKMTAVVGELASFSIKRKAAESSHSRHSTSLSPDSSKSSSQSGQDHTTMFSSSQGNEENAGDVYVYRDSRGDVFVMQDITDQTETAATTQPTTAIVRTADDDSASGAASYDLRRLSLNESVTVDTKNVDVKKAREVISAFLTEGSSTKPMEPKRHVQRDSTLRDSLGQSSEFRVVAGNVGINGVGQGYNSTMYQTDLTPYGSSQTDTRYYNTQYHPPAANQQQRESVTVSTTSTAVIGEQSELQIQIPRNAVPVLPILPGRLNSTETHSDITPMLRNTPLPTPPTFTSNIPSQAILTSSQQPYSHSSSRILSSSTPNPIAMYELETSHGDRTYTSQTTLERNSFGSRTNAEEDWSYRNMGESRPRVTSGSSLSSDDERHDQKHYMITRLARTNSDQQKDRSYSTDSILKASRQTVGSGRVYDSAASFPSNGKSSQVTVINNVNASRTSVSFGENDSQYGSQTSKTTSGGDMSPTDDHLYRIIRADKSPSSPTSPTRFTSSPPSRQPVLYHTLDRATRATTNYQQRQLNSSHEALFRESSGSNKSSDLWRVDGFSRSQPELSVPLLNKSLSTAPHPEEDAEGQQYRLVKTGHSGQKVRSSSSESDDDSGVDGGKRYRMVSRVQVGGSKKRSSSTGSIKNAQLSLRPRSPSPPSRNYRLSKAQPLSSWEQYQEQSRDTEGNLYRVTRVLSSEDLPRDVEQTINYRTVGAVGTDAKLPPRSTVARWDENNNDRPFRVMQTLPSDKQPTRKDQVFREAHSFDDSWPYRHRTTSPPPRALSPGPKELHRTVINLKVDDDKILPTTHFTETEGQQYRVVNIKSSDDNHGVRERKGDSVYTAHNRSFPSPVSGYESDQERSNSNKMYGVSTTRQQRPANSHPENSISSRHYVINSTQPSSTLEDGGVSRRELRPRVASPPLQSPTGEWHMTTIEIKRNPSRGMRDHNPQTMAPLQEQQSKSYVVFNSLDDITQNVSTTRPLQRSNSQTFTSERQFKVMSPTPTTFTKAPYRGFLSGSSRPPEVVRSEDESSSSFSREVYEEKTYQVHQDPTHLMPPGDVTEDEKDLRVLRGKILIQNRLDDSRDHDDFLHNMNVFDTSFHLDKDNPLYQSDPDIYKSLEAELQEQEQKSNTIGQEVTQDITWETVDRIAQKHKSGETVELSPKPRRKQNLSTMLLSKLASIDSKDLRQHIDVQHHHEEIYGDIHLVHADGSTARSAHTSNFDSVNENVELELKKGKAFVIIKVIAERIVPIDYEFNVWRKSQAIVTRNIEIDLHATAQRRRLYEHVMETGGRMPGALEDSDGHDRGATIRSPRRFGEGGEERQLTSLETLRLFSQILEVSEGRGDSEDTEVKTRQEMGMLPETSSSNVMDLLY